MHVCRSKTLHPPTCHFISITPYYNTLSRMQLSTHKQHNDRGGKSRHLDYVELKASKENSVCTFSKTHINEVTRFLANTARYSPPTFFTMESTKYKTGSFSDDGAWSNRKLTSLEKQQVKSTFQYNAMSTKILHCTDKESDVSRGEGGGYMSLHPHQLERGENI